MYARTTNSARRTFRLSSNSIDLSLISKERLKKKDIFLHPEEINEKFTVLESISREENSKQLKKSITWFLDKWIPRYYGVISFLQNLFRMLRNSPERDNQFLTEKKVNSQNNQRDSTVYHIGWKDAMKIKWKMDILSMHLAQLIEQSHQEV